MPRQIWFALAALLVLAAAAPARPPNFVVVFCDDLGYGDIGCYGAKGGLTPNVDRMAKEGVRFTDFYVAQPVCSASRAALLTGCYPNRLGILGALGPTAKIGISDKEQTLADLLKARGYATAIYGKWHLGSRPAFLPTRHGFGDYFGLPYSNDMKPGKKRPQYPPLPLFAGEKVVATEPDQSKLTAQYTERAVAFIEKNKAKPFFLYVPHTMPHVPLAVSAQFAGKSKRGLYGDIMMELDWSVGRILAALKKNDLDDDTLVIFTSDNGPWLIYGDHAGSAGPLREGKATTWDGGVRVPCVMRWPGKIAAGGVRQEPAMTIDLLPTLVGLAGAKLPKNKIDGKDVWPLIRGTAATNRSPETYFFYWGDALQGLRSGKWKLHFPHPYPTLGGGPGGRDGEPVKAKQGRTGLALYNLDVDPGEKVDVAEKHPEVVERLRKLAEVMRADLGDTRTKTVGKGRRQPGRVE